MLLEMSNQLMLHLLVCCLPVRYEQNSARLDQTLDRSPLGSSLIPVQGRCRQEGWEASTRVLRGSQFGVVVN